MVANTGRGAPCSIAVTAVPGGAGLPTDGDAVLDDVSGDGRVDLADLVCLFNRPRGLRPRPSLPRVTGLPGRSPATRPG